MFVLAALKRPVQLLSSVFLGMRKLLVYSLSLLLLGCVDEIVEPTTLKVGDVLNGGVIAFVENGHGFIVDTTDLGLLDWYEAQAAADSNNTWRLPRLGEMQIIYSDLHLNNRGGFDSNIGYWSITEASAGSAWYVEFRDGRNGYTNKTQLRKAVAVKTF